MEATGVLPEGRITPACLGIWSDEHISTLKRVTDFSRAHGAAIGIQLAHAGRKAGTDLPWKGGKLLPPDKGGWLPLAPSPVAFSDSYAVPKEMTLEDIARVRAAFASAARRAVKAGFQIVEIHAAHGYLLDSFFSPLSNKRTDRYGGSFDNRARLILEIAGEVRAAVSDETVVAARLSCVDWKDGGVTLEESISLSAELKKCGVDLIDCSSGGLVADVKIPVAPGYQVPFAAAIRARSNIATAAVGLITQARQADGIIKRGEADIVLLGREMLRDPYWPLRAAKELGAEAPVPPQYLRAF